MPSRTEQADLFHALYAGHGDFPRAVLGVFDSVHARDVMNKAFHLAESYQLPVLVLSDAYIAQRREIRDAPVDNRGKPRRWVWASEHGPAHFKLTGDHVASPFRVPGTPGGTYLAARFTPWTPGDYSTQMPVSKDLAREVIRRLTQYGSLDVLAQRLAPISPEVKPLPPDVPRPSDWSGEARAQRIAFLEARGIDLPQLAGRGVEVDPETLRGNIEQYVGMTQVPTGLIGPLRVNGVHAHGDYYVPLATTEGTLVASYHRGARLASRAGGVAAMVTTEQVQRAPGFAFAGLADAAVFAAWATTQFEHLRDVAATRSKHGQLIDLLAHIEANHVYLILAYHTGDAAGQNMVTFCTEAVCEALLAGSPVKPVSWFIEANMSGDKKATVLSFLHTRGRHVMAEVTLPRRLVEKGLHTTPDRMAEYWRMSFVGGAQSGSIGVSGHVANGIAALFLACGQDVACVSEASVGITRLELTPAGDLYCAVTLPNLIAGTVGGGTRMPTARECLRILRCEGAVEDKQTAAKFGEIAAALALAGELSIVGAICAGEFSRAHQRFGRAPAS